MGNVTGKLIRVATVLLLLCLLIPASAQFVAVKSGAWNVGTTWGVTTCASGCTAGVDYPGINDDAYTEGFSVSVPTGTFQVNNLYVKFNVANGITKGLGSPNLTVNSELAAYDESTPGDFTTAFYQIPTTTVINTTNGLTLTFTGLNNTSVINGAGWSSAAPLGKPTFNPGAGNTVYLPSMAVASAGTLTVTSGTLEVDGVLQSASSSSGTITISSGATLFVNGGSISGSTGTSSSSFPTVTVNGTLQSASDNASYINAATLTLNSGSTLTVGFHGSNQTQGWWYQSQLPTTFTPNVASTVNYNAAGAQNVYAQTYGNLTLDAPSASTKTLSGPAGALTVNGNFNINSANVTFNPSSTMHFAGNLTSSTAFAPTGLVFLSGAGAVNIGGSGSYSFGGGLKVSSGSPTLSTTMSVSNGITVDPGATLNLSSNTVTLSGDLAVNGTLTPSTSTLVIAGTTALTGNATASLNNITINSGGHLTGATTSTTIGGALINNGTYTAPISSILTVNGSFSNGSTGTFTPSSSSSLTTNGTFTNSGSFTAPPTFNVNSDFANTGTFTANSGTVTFGNSASQSITGTTSFYNMNVSNTSGTVSVNGNANLNGTLTLTSTSAAFDADGAGSGIFTVKSTAVNAGGRIAALPQTANFTGNVTIERFIDSPPDWRYPSMPITNGNVGEWKTYFPVTGSFSDASPSGTNNVTSSSAPSIYYWNATTAAWVALGSGGSTSSTALGNTTGYSAYTYMSSDITVSVRGTMAKGNISIPLGTGGSGYNLIANPYPSPIDWDNITLPGSLSTTMSVTQANNVFSAYVKGGAATNPPFTGWTGEVAMGQSFWVQSTGATTFSLGESAKTGNVYQFERVAPLNNLIRVSLIAGSQKDDAVIWFQPDATDTLDAYDASKRKNGFNISPLANERYVNISTYNLSSANDYAINGIANLSCSKSVMMKVEDVPVGTNKLFFSDLSTFSMGYNITLVDHFLNKQVTVSDSLEYNFDVTADPKSFGDTRFELQLSPAKPQVSVTGMLLTSPSTRGNQWLLNGVPIPGATGTKYLATQSGTYSLQVTSGTCTLTSTDVVLSVTGLENTPDGVKTYPNPVKDKLTIETIGNYSVIQIFDDQGRLAEFIDASTVDNAKSIEVNFSRYSRGLYIVRVHSDAGDYSTKIVKE